MNTYLKNLIKLGSVVAGKILIENGFVIFEREDNLEKLNEIDEKDIAFATTAMGRAIFQIDSDGKIINIKGVDSHLNNVESASMSLVSAEAIYIPNENKNYQDSTYPLNLVIFPGNRPDIRIRGASPLEDLEIEADINSKMQGTGIKLPKIKSVREFSEEFAIKYGLPIKIDGNIEEFDSNYKQEDLKRKKYLREIYGDNYKEIIIRGKRPETLGEYFRRKEIFERPEILEFVREKSFEIDDFIRYVDSSYSLGQRYGQAERILKNPFRIADIEYYVKRGDIEILENIISFSESLQETKEPMENYFAKQMGENLGHMLNSGWMCENLSHRQDYTLAGEMCDDSYSYLPDKILETQKYEDGKRIAIQKDLIKRYFYQIFGLGATIKVLEDEMKLRGKTKEQIESVFDDFMNSFNSTLDLEKVNSVIGIDSKKIFEILVKKPTDYQKLISSKITKEGVVFDDEILFSHKDNNSFFNKISFRLADMMGIKRSFYSEKDDTTKSLILE